MMQTTENSIHLVACTHKHRAMLAELGGTTFYEAFAPFHEEEDMQAYIHKTYNIPQVEKNLHNSNIVYYAAYDEAGDQGYIKLIENASADKLEGRLIELEKIYVRAAKHGSGIANALMQKAVDLATQKNYNYLFLGVWQENHRALAFYKKWNFEVFNTRSFTLGKTVCDDFLLYRKL